MLASWTEILPLFVVRWMARRYAERLPVPGSKYHWHHARHDVLIRATEQKEK